MRETSVAILHQNVNEKADTQCRAWPSSFKISQE